MNEKSFKDILTQKITDNIKNLNSSSLEQHDKITIILQALLNIDQEFPKLGLLKERIITSFLASIPEANQSNSKELEELCSQLIGENRKDKTLLHYAVEYKNNTLVKKLLDAGFKDSSYNKFRNSAFNASVEAFIKCKTTNGSSEAESVNNLKELTKIIETLIKEGKKNINEPDETGKTDIDRAISNNNIDLLAIYNNSDEENPPVTKVVNTTSKKTPESLFHYAIRKSNIKTIKYLIDIGADICKLTKGEKSPQDIAKQRLQSSINEDERKENEIIYEYLGNKIQVKTQLARNQEAYQKQLFELDASIIEHINISLNSLKQIYQTNRFLDSVLVKNYIFRMDQGLDDLLQLSNQTQVNDQYDNIIFVHLKQTAKYVGLLGNHENSIKNKLSMFPWELLQSLPEILVKNPLYETNLRKLLELISSDIIKLSEHLRRLVESYTDTEQKISFKKFKAIKISKELLPGELVYNLTYLTFIASNSAIISSTIKEVETLEKLDLVIEEDKFFFIQTLQNLGEYYKHFSPQILQTLESNGFGLLKKIRDEHTDIYRRIQNTKKFLKIIEGSNLSKNQLREITTFLTILQGFVVEYYKKSLNELQDQLKDLLLQEPKSLANLQLSISLEKDNQNKANVVKTYTLKALLDLVALNEIEEQNFIGINSIATHMNLILYFVNKIQNLVTKITTKHNNDYQRIREELQVPKTHSMCLLLLTMIGENIHAIKEKPDFLSTASFELLQELDFLRWVRNALMHSDNINETGTLVDYLSNDLLTEFSIVSHGQKVIEFSKYFEECVTKLIKTFQSNLQSHDINYNQSYDEEDKKYLEYDITQRKKYITSVIANNQINKRSPNKQLEEDRTPDLTIDNFLKYKNIIEQKCTDLKIEIKGLFGKLANFGYAKIGDSSGLLVRVTEGDMLYATAIFKKYLYTELRFRLKVVEEKQIEEYFKLKITNDAYRQEYQTIFLQKISKRSLEHLNNNIQILNLINKLTSSATKLDLINFLIEIHTEKLSKSQELVKTLKTELVKNISQLLYSTEKISFELIYKEETPILHHLCTTYQRTKSNFLFNVLKAILQKGADIGVQDIYGNTILHNISWNECDEQLLSYIKEYIQPKHCNQLNLYDECPLETAIQNNNFQLIEFLKDKTDIEKYNKQLLIAAVKYGNVDFISYLISEYNIIVNTQDENGKPVIHYAIFPETEKPQELQQQYREIIKLLLKNGAQISQFDNKYTRKQESPLLWALENKDIELALLLAENSISVNYENEDHDYPIHLAILNLKNCFSTQRPDYLKLIKTIVEKTAANGYSLNQEYHGGAETPLYLAAQAQDIEVMEILLQNGADANYKNHRFISQVLSKVNNLEVIKLLLKYNIRLNFKHCSTFIQKVQQICSDSLKKLKEIDTNKATREELKNAVQNIYSEVGNYTNYIDFEKINTVKQIKEEIVNLKDSLQDKQNLSAINDYLNNHDRLLELYINNKTDELKELVKTITINLQIINEEGKSLFVYAIQKQDTDFIKWLSEHDGINISFRFSDPVLENPNRKTNYYRHLSNYANGTMLEVLHNKKLIDWNEFDDYEIKEISTNAIKNNDITAIQLLETHKYVDIQDFVISNDNQVEQHLAQYRNVFNQIEQGYVREELKNLIRNLPNKLLLFKNMTLLHIAVSVSNLDIVRFLIKEIRLNILNFTNNTPLDVAVEYNSNKEIFDYLIEQQGEFGDFSLNNSVLSRNSILSIDKDKQDLLLNYIETTPKIKEAIIKPETANSYINNPEAIKILLKFGWDPNKYSEGYSVFEGGYTALHECLAKHYNATLKILCEYNKIDLELPVKRPIIFLTSGIITPVGWALEHKNFDGAKILIENGASPYKYLVILLS